VSIWGLHWPWRTKKGRTIESRNKRGHVRVKCLAGGSPVIGDIAVSEGLRTTQCPECGRDVGVTGPIHRPQLFVHNGDYVL
jgi:hypothetical protein